MAAARKNTILVAAFAAAILALCAVPPHAVAEQDSLLSGNQAQHPVVLNASTLVPSYMALDAASDARTFAILPEARYLAGVSGDTFSCTVKIGIQDSLYTRVEYPSNLSDLSMLATSDIDSDGYLALSISMRGNEASFQNAMPITMRFYHALAKTWVERSVDVNLDRQTLEIGGGELGVEAVKGMIESLPFDPLDVRQSDSTAVAATQLAYECLSESDRNRIDTDIYKNSNAYGRSIESCLWALDSLGGVDNTTSLADGTYTNKATSHCNMGKSSSARQRLFDLNKIEVKSGKAYGIIEHQTSASDLVYLGGQAYAHTNTDESAHSTYRIPIALNETFHIIVLAKNPTADTVGIAYEMGVEIDEASVTPDADEADSGNDNADSSSDGNSKSSAGTKGGSNSNGSAGSGKSSGSASGNAAAGKSGSSSGEGNGDGSSLSTASGSGAASLLASLSAKRNSSGTSSSSSKSSSSSSAKSGESASGKLIDASSSRTSSSSVGGVDSALGANSVTDANALIASEAVSVAAPIAISLLALALAGALAFLGVFKLRERRPARKVVG